jgi:hypothetical protein
VIKENNVPEHIHSGVLSDKIIEVVVNNTDGKIKFELHKKKYYN